MEAPEHGIGGQLVRQHQNHQRDGPCIIQYTIRGEHRPLDERTHHDLCKLQVEKGSRWEEDLSAARIVDQLQWLSSVCTAIEKMDHRPRYQSLLSCELRRLLFLNRSLRVVESLHGLRNKLLLVEDDSRFQVCLQSNLLAPLVD